MSQPETPLVIIIDDDDGLRRSLAFLIATIGLECRGFDNAEHFLRDCPHGDFGRPGCILMDVRMPGMSGLELLRILRERGSALPVLMITGHGDVPMAVAALKAGADDFIEKPFNDQHLLDAITMAVRTSRQRLVDSAGSDAVIERAATLSAREREVLWLVMAGKANKVIAFDLGVSIKTVELHRHSLMEKMQVGSVAELARQVTLAGLKS